MKTLPITMSSSSLKTVLNITVTRSFLASTYLKTKIKENAELMKHWDHRCKVNDHYYRQHCAQRKPSAFNLLRGRFWGFSLRRGDMMHRWGSNLAWTFLHAKFHPHRCNSKGVGPKKTEIFTHDLTKMGNINATQGCIPCAIFTKFAEFVPHFRMR